MHTANTIIMRAPKELVFETAANLAGWPEILPHYRFIRYLERDRDHNLVIMAARRGPLPISWTSEQIIDRERCEIRFHHLKAWTKGMDVVWSFRETPAGVVVEIRHDLRFRIRFLAPLIEPIISNLFIHPVAARTLQCMKARLESSIENRESKFENV
jgi:ribosome-associated toxin RatA of RatAB toxin-antitoxin module